MKRDVTVTQNNGGIGFCSLLLILFIALKLLHVITWSWWWVLSPFWIPIAVAFLIAFFAAILAALSE